MESWYVTAVLNRCPHCQEATLFTGYLKLPDCCPQCGVRYERWAGSWTGPTVGGYGIGAATAVVLMFLAHITGWLVPGIEWAIAVISALVAGVALRFVKGAWIGMLYDWGYIFADPKPPIVPAV